MKKSNALQKENLIVLIILIIIFITTLAIYFILDVKEISSEKPVNNSSVKVASINIVNTPVKNYQD